MAKKRTRRKNAKPSDVEPQFELGFESPKEIGDTPQKLSDVRNILDELTSRIGDVVQNELQGTFNILKSFDTEAIDKFKEARDDVNADLVALQDKLKVAIGNQVENAATFARGIAEKLEKCVRFPPGMPEPGNYPPGVDVRACKIIWDKVMRACRQATKNDPRFDEACRRCGWKAAMLECGWRPPRRPPPDRSEPRPIPPRPEPPDQPQPPLPPESPSETPRPPAPPDEPLPRPPSPPPGPRPGPLPPDDEPVVFPPLPPGPIPPRPPRPGEDHEGPGEDHDFPEQPKPKPDEDDEPSPGDTPLPSEPIPAPGDDKPGETPTGDTDEPGPIGEGPDPRPETPDTPHDIPGGGNGDGGGNGQQCPTCPLCDTEHQPTQCCPPDSSEPVEPPEDVPVDPPLEPDDDDYCVWFDVKTESCYIQFCDREPHNEDDKRLGWAKTPQGAINLASRVCKPKQTGPTTEHPIWQLITAFRRCEVDHYIKLGGFGLPGSTNAWPSVVSGINSTSVAVDKNPSGGPIMGGITKMFGHLGKIVGRQIDATAQKWGQESSRLVGCNWLTMGGWWMLRIGQGILNNWVSSAFDELGVSLKYASHRDCPSLFPDKNEATEAFLHNTIDAGLFENWLRINNQCPQPWERVVQARRARFGVGELIELRRRDCLSQTAVASELRGLGFLHPNDLEKFNCLIPAIPAVTELIRYMVRDVEDENIVTRFKLDTNFGNKFKGKVAQWAQDQGVSEDVMRRSWRAHWIIPGPHQLFEMWHRNRLLPPTDPAYVDEAMVRVALEQQDILPHWIERLIKVSFRRLTRVDTRRAFDIGVIDFTEVEEVYKSWGYSDENANTLAKFAHSQKMAKIKRSPDVTMFENGVLSERELRSRLDNRDVDHVTMESIIRDKTLKLRAVKRQTCAKLIRRRFLLGELELHEVTSRLIKLGFDVLDAEIQGDIWQCELQAMGKEAPAAKLCQWLEEQLITPAQFLNRLERVGWSEADALRLLVDCLAKVGQKIEKKFIADAKARAKEAERLRKLAQKAQKDAERKERQLEKAREKAALARDKRERALVRAADKYKDQEGINLDDAMMEVKRVHTLIRASFPLTPDEAVQAVVLGVEKRPKKNAPPLDLRAVRVADGLVSALDIVVAPRPESGDDEASDEGSDG